MASSVFHIRTLTSWSVDNNVGWMEGMVNEGMERQWNKRIMIRVDIRVRKWMRSIWVNVQKYLSLHIHSTAYLATWCIQAISIVPPQVHYYSEALQIQHGYCVKVSRRSATGNCEWRTCPRSPNMWRPERNSIPRPFGRKAPNLPMSHHAPQWWMNECMNEWANDVKNILLLKGKLCSYLHCTRSLVVASTSGCPVCAAMHRISFSL